MALDKAIKSGKEHRKPYRKAQAVDGMCRPGGGCSWCEGNRQWFDTKHRRIAQEKLEEYYDDADSDS
jgi:hypothetical protein